MLNETAIIWCSVLTLYFGRLFFLFFLFFRGFLFGDIFVSCAQKFTKLCSLFWLEFSSYGVFQKVNLKGMEINCFFFRVPLFGINAK